MVRFRVDPERLLQHYKKTNPKIDDQRIFGRTEFRVETETNRLSFVAENHPDTFEDKYYMESELRNLEVLESGQLRVENPKKFIRTLNRINDQTKKGKKVDFEDYGSELHETELGEPMKSVNLDEETIYFDNIDYSRRHDLFVVEMPEKQVFGYSTELSRVSRHNLLKESSEGESCKLNVNLSRGEPTIGVEGFKADFCVKKFPKSLLREPKSRIYTQLKGNQLIVDLNSSSDEEIWFLIRGGGN